MRFRLRTLLIVLAVGPVVLVGAWWIWRQTIEPPDTFIHDTYIDSTNSRALRKPPMFRFTIRELVLLTLVVAMGVGWRLDHAHQARYVAIVSSNDTYLLLENERLRNEVAKLQKRILADLGK
jgi:hypothetical protein